MYMRIYLNKLECSSNNILIVINAHSSYNKFSKVINVVVFQVFRWGCTSERLNFFEFLPFGIQRDDASACRLYLWWFFDLYMQLNYLYPQLSLYIVWCQNSLCGYFLVHVFMHTHDKFYFTEIIMDAFWVSDLLYYIAAYH